MTVEPNTPLRPPPYLIVGECHCGEPGLIGVVAGGAYCLGHLDDALLAIERIRLDLGGVR